MNCGFLGPKDTYSHLAAKELSDGETLVCFASFPLLFSALKEGGCESIVVPVENTLNGGVGQTLDLLQSSSGICAVKECALKIDHRLATLTPDLSKIKRIYSHSQALQQCSKYISENFPKAQCVPTLSTAAGLAMLKSEEDACIVGSHAKKDGVIISENCISDVKSNFTHFLKITCGEIDPDKKTGKIFFSVTCKNVSGALLSILTAIHANGLNMTKLQSRPIKERCDEYRFFIETDGDYSDKAVRRGLEEIEKNSLSFKLLGAY